jgi:protein-disulfide isomerase
MDFPIESIHKKALKAHVAANCAGDQGKYWEAHSRLFKTKAFTPNDLTKLAKTLGLNMQEFETCMNSEKYVAEIRNDQTQGRKAGVRGTPAFYFGLTIPNSSTIRVTKYFRGGQPYAKFEKVIEELLQAKK